MEQDKKTIGELAYDMHNRPQDACTFFEQANADMTGLDKVIKECYDLGKKGLPHKDFFIEIQLKWERILQDRVFRIYPFVRRSCPTPQYDQTVFHYHHKDDMLEYLWTLPDQESYNFYATSTEYVTPDRYPLLKHVLSDASGELLNRVNTINKKLFK